MISSLKLIFKRTNLAAPLLFVLGFICAIACMVAFFQFLPRWSGISPKAFREMQANTQIPVLDSDLNDRTSYRAIDFSSDYWFDFDNEYTRAVEESASWIRHPWGFVYQYLILPMEYPEFNEWPYPITMNIQFVSDYWYEQATKSNKVIVVVTDLWIPDDSIEALQTRVDLTFVKKAWQLEWAGEKWQCRRTWDKAWTSSQLCP